MILSCSLMNKLQHPSILSRRSVARFLATITQVLFTNNPSVAMRNGGGSTIRIIDSHVHVWADTITSAIYPYAEGQTPPPPSIIDRGSPHHLLSQMSQSGVAGALIVQPIHHMFDHSYLIATIRAHPTKFKGMLLFDPSSSQSSPLAIGNYLEELMSHGFVGVRFNPYLWPEGQFMSDETSPNSGLAVYKHCGTLGLPVGIMCFKGLHLHYKDICSLIQESSNTKLILDHFAFTRLDDHDTQDENFDKLLSLSKFPNVFVKIAALFRIVPTSNTDSNPYEALQTKRFKPLVKAFGAQRLLFGTDFPYVVEQEGEYRAAVEIVQSWAAEYGEEAQRSIMAGTAERLFGTWGQCEEVKHNTLGLMDKRIEWNGMDSASSI